MILHKVSALETNRFSFHLSRLTSAYLTGSVSKKAPKDSSGTGPL